MESAMRGVRLIVAVLACLCTISQAHAGLFRASKKDNASQSVPYTLQVGGVERSYRVFNPIPQGVSKLVPLVIMLHGGGGNAENAEKMSGFNAEAEKGGFVVVYPNGSGRREDKLLTWNAGHCCGYAMKQHVDDVAFISALIDHMVAHFSIDPKRVYVTGMSNGGMMTHRIGRELSSKVAAIAPVVAGLFGDESGAAVTSPVSVMTINGVLDKSVPAAGGKSGGFAAFAWDKDATLQPVEYQGKFWAAANHCTAQLQQFDTISAKAWGYSCPENVHVNQFVVLDNGHAWPGGQKGSRMGDEPSQQFLATHEIWAFFQVHMKP